MACTPELNTFWRSLHTSKLTDFGSLLKASGNNPPRSNDLTVLEFCTACQKKGIETKRVNVTVEDVVWSCIIPHCLRTPSTMVSKMDLNAFEQRFGSTLAGGFVRAASLLTHVTTAVADGNNSVPSTTNTTTCLVSWFLPVAHLKRIDLSNQRLINKGIESSCFGRFATTDETTKYGICLVLTVSSSFNKSIEKAAQIVLGTYDIFIGCGEKGFFVLGTHPMAATKTLTCNKVLPSSTTMFDDYSLELGGLFECLLISGVASGIFVRATNRDWPGQSPGLVNQTHTCTKTESTATRVDSNSGGLFNSMFALNCCTGERSKTIAKDQPIKEYDTGGSSRK